MRFILMIIPATISCFWLSGCVPVIVASGAAAGGYVVVRDKPLGESIVDTKIETAIKAKLYKANKELYSKVSVIVDEGAVLLTGVVSDDSFIEIAEKEAWSVDGVKIVDNNIYCGPEIPVSVMLKDNWITSSARASLICQKNIRSVNYKIKTMDGIVYVTGIARDEIEMNNTLSAIQKISRVKKVVSYVKLAETKNAI